MTKVAGIVKRCDHSVAEAMYRSVSLVCRHYVVNSSVGLYKFIYYKIVHEVPKYIVMQYLKKYI